MASRLCASAKKGKTSSGGARAAAARGAGRDSGASRGLRASVRQGSGGGYARVHDRTRPAAHRDPRPVRAAAAPPRVRHGARGVRRRDEARPRVDRRPRPGRGADRRGGVGRRGSRRGGIGGPAPHSAADPALDPVYEAGGGEQDGWEQAERDLIENASHGDGHGNPLRDALEPEDESDLSGAEYGEADHWERRTEASATPTIRGAGPAAAADRGCPHREEGSPAPCRRTRHWRHPAGRGPAPPPRSRPAAPRARRPSAGRRRRWPRPRCGGSPRRPGQEAGGEGVRVLARQMDLGELFAARRRRRSRGSRTARRASCPPPGRCPAPSAARRRPGARGDAGTRHDRARERGGLGDPRQRTEPAEVHVDLARAAGRPPAGAKCSAPPTEMAGRGLPRTLKSRTRSAGRTVRSAPSRKAKPPPSAAPTSDARVPRESALGPAPSA